MWRFSYSFSSKLNVYHFTFCRSHHEFDRKYGNKDSNLIEKLYLCADKDLKTKSVYEKNIVYHGFDSRFVGNDNDGFVP